jgi:protein-L-isoaspartate(D-aspartate) O-methyltransferase
VTARGQLGELAEELRAAGVFGPGWENVFYEVPRDRFVPEVIWVQDDPHERPDGDYFPLRRGDDPQRWESWVFGDGYVVTQVDRGVPSEPGAVGDNPSSSISQPSLVFRMLRELGLQPHMRVLEIGTGSGWNAALLSQRQGEANITTVEIDPAVAEQAKGSLAKAGYAPTVVAAEGAEGYRPNAPYDRVIATCSVRQVPRAWIEQTRPGGMLLLPFATAYHTNALVRLGRDDDGTARGRFVGDAAFMALRCQELPWGQVRDFLHHEDEADKSTTTVNLLELTNNQDLQFAVGVLVPGCEPAVIHARDGTGEFTLWLFDLEADPPGESWASADYEPDTSAYTVEQYGLRRLWDEVEAAYQWWENTGRPERERFGLTVTPDTQTVWLDDPDGPHTWTTST